MEVVVIEQTPTVLQTLQTEYKKTVFSPKSLKLISLLHSGHGLCTYSKEKSCLLIYFAWFNLE